LVRRYWQALTIVRAHCRGTHRRSANWREQIRLGARLVSAILVMGLALHC
jgi:hypothetical protein